MKELLANKAKTAVLVAAAAVLLAAAGLGYFLIRKPSNVQTVPGETRSSAVEKISGEGSAQPLQGKSASTSPGRSEKLSLEDQLVMEMKKFYGKTISQKSIQMNLLRVKRFLLQRYPEDGSAMFYRIVKRAFPDLADEIIITLKKMEQYKNWVEENANRLSEMNKLEKEGAIWEKRTALFGEEAREMWSEEILAFEEKKQQVHETISYLDEAEDLTIYEKLDIYRDTLRDAYEGSSEAFVLQNIDLQAKVFFGIDSVQNELKQLDPEQRQWEINKIRTEMGFTQAQVEKMEEMDDYRNRRWENGLAYIAEREIVMQEADGPEREDRLKELRVKYFKHEAKTIELEEKDGFFRYNRPRVYGRN